MNFLGQEIPFVNRPRRRIYLCGPLKFNKNFKIKYRDKSRYFQTVDKVILWCGRVRETNGFPEWNPQSEFISDEENSRFQGF